MNFPNTILTTARLGLRPLQAGDAAAVFGMMSDPETMRFWDWPAFDDPDVVAEIVAGQLAQVAAETAIYWAVHQTGGDALLGICDLSGIDTHHRNAEVGFLFSRAHWGNGFAREAMEKIVAYAFGPLGFERLWARLHAGNLASSALLGRLNFSHEGTLKGHVLRDGERRDCEIWGRLE